ncbi:MAG: GNAT family N-acetyltransferase [Clostridia bacterium]|nr:GNAT family N-acetyltransferase [Clostridia bacterium]
MLETTRLRLYPATQAQMEAMIAEEKNLDLRQAYREMLTGCLSCPDQWDWYAMWVIEAVNGTRVGDICFKGPGENGRPEIGYGILTEFQGRGYATEAVRAALAWAFRHPEVRAVEAETDPDNKVSQRVLAKCGFAPNGTAGEEGPRFTATRQGFLQSKTNCCEP